MKGRGAPPHQKGDLPPDLGASLQDHQVANSADFLSCFDLRSHTGRKSFWKPTRRAVKKMHTHTNTNKQTKQVCQEPTDTGREEEGQGERDGEMERWRDEMKMR